MPKPKSTRRSFLIPKPKREKQLATFNFLARGRYQTHQHFQTGIDAYGHLVSVRRKAMATKFEIMFSELDERATVSLCMDALSVIDDVESQLTVYRDTSEVSRLNATAYQHPVEVSSNLYELIERSRRIWEETDGAFDITSGPLLRLWGIHDRNHRIPSESEIENVMQCVGMQHIRLYPETHAISLDRPGMELNFGSNGKGYAVDCAVGFLREEGVPVAYVQGGGSSHYGMGAPEWDTGWRIDIADPLRGERNIGTLTLCNLGMATSGVKSMRHDTEGLRYRHIVDPRTGRLAEGLLGATVVTPRAEEADALATAFTILGVERGREYCQTHPNVGMLLVRAGGSEPKSDTEDAELETVVLGVLDHILE